jgi:hypothetical protein
MRRKTTTKKLQQAIKDDLLKLTKVEKYSKSTRKTTTISTDTFKDDLDFICETLFADVVGWHYEYDIKAKQYIIECGRMDGDVDFIFIAHLCACDGVKVESVDKALRVIDN